MLKQRLIPLLLGFLLLLSGCATRLDKQTEFLKYKDSLQIARIDQRLSSFMEDNGLVGMSVGIYKDHYVNFFNYGVTQAGGAPISEETQFEIGTMSQIFTGHVFGEYVFRGYLTPETPITNYYSYLNLPLWEGEIAPTNQDLATHRSGFASSPDNLPQGENPYAEYDELALRRYLSTSALEHEPGTVYNPGGMDMALTGFLLRTVIGPVVSMDFEPMVKYSIMYRIGMTKTTITMTEEQEEVRAMPHDANGNVTSVQDYDGLSGIGGMAGFKSSAYDLLNYATVHMNRFPIAQGDWNDLNSDAEGGEVRRKALGRLTVEQRMTGALTVATAEQYSEEGVSIGYGYNLDQMNGQKYVWQSGESLGYAAYFGVVPGTETAVVVLVNGPVDVAALGEEILTIIQ